MLEFLTQKQDGDAKRIAELVNAKRIENNKTTMPYGAIRAMLNGNRKISEEVKHVAQAYFEKQQELQTIKI